MDKLNKKGALAKTEDGRPVLVNDKQESYAVSEEIVAIWQMCDGTKTEDEISTTLTEKTSMESAQVRKIVSEIVSKLKEVELMG